MSDTPRDDCEPGYGFLPCSTNTGGALFLTVIYGALVKGATKLISDGSDYVVDSNVIPRNILGGLLLPLFGAMPAALLILCASVATSDVGPAAIGLMCGLPSALMLLWGAAVFVGRCEMHEGFAVNKLLRNPCDLAQTGVSTDPSTPGYAWYAMASVGCYLLVQTPAVFGATDLRPAYILGSVLSLLAAVLYLTYQVMGTEYARRNEESRRSRYFRYNIVRSLAYYSNRYGGILQPDGSLNTEAIHRIFARFDRDKNGLICREELAGMLLGMDFANPNDPQLLDAFIDTTFRQFDLESSAAAGGASGAANGGSATRGGGRMVQGAGALLRTSSAAAAAALPDGSGGPGQAEVPAAAAAAGTKAAVAASESVAIIADSSSGSAATHVAVDIAGAAGAAGAVPARAEGGVVSTSVLLGRAEPQATQGITEEMFVKVLQGWFAEKQKRFKEDFPHEEAPKQVRRAGTTAMWLLTKQAPEEYKERLLGGSGGRDLGTCPCEEDDAEEAELPSSGVSFTTATTQPTWPAWQSLSWGLVLVVGGALALGLAAVPFTLSLADLSRTSGMPLLVLAFLAGPLAACTVDAQAALQLAARRRSRAISMVFSQVYGGLTLQHTLCLGLLWSVMAARGAAWLYTPECALVALGVVALCALGANHRTIKTLW
eukprot:CAMPEP_0202907840 /NCGR_PEP_ID=MMETSP1392-20130828/44030_1 /ASSEMBLY_ACC=CAM_ASM_000868 /TAXON_ID=225041 /ORGANISM="Chlamydomonas chlamydogama, Strain SAG 11-48b" /LENGTH=658 /DNA_ID=CAMNT_0049596907 /DNA_START=142 /DNA_END=2115 /DNA_ORIENTATION=+